MRSAACSPITTQVAIVFPVVMRGMIEASARRKQSMPDGQFARLVFLQETLAFLRSVAALLPLARMRIALGQVHLGLRDR